MSQTRADHRLLGPESLAGLDAEVDGPVLSPDDPAYAAECATYNLRTPLAPAVVVGATSVADVQAAVRFATRRGMPVAVRGGGHAVTDSARDALLINLGRMHHSSVDPQTRTARIAGGAVWRQVLDAATPHGLAPMNGSAPTVGAVGYLLGGGHSPTLGRTLGYADEYVTSIDVVTADGDLHTATATDEADLHFALRGSRGNFGVVTAVETEVFPVTRLYGGGLYFAGERAADVLHVWRNWVAGVPPEMTSSVAILRLPPMPTIPEPIRGAFLVHVRIAYLGDAAEGETLVAPLRAIGPRVLDTVREMPYAEVGTIHSDPPDPLPYVEGATGLREFSPATIDALLDLAGPDSECPLVGVEVRPLGGALDHTPATPDAVPSRGLPFQTFAFGVGGPDEIDGLRSYLDVVIDGLASWTDPHMMVNFLGPDDPDSRLREVYGPDIYDRLAQVKAAYDPDNTFRANHNIPPASG